LRVWGRTTVAIGVLALLVLVGASCRGSDGASLQSHAPVVFVCKNGVAMSVWSAFTFNRLAADRGLSVRAISRAAEPTFTRVPLNMRLALALDGFGIGDYEPRVVGFAEVRAAERVILIDAQLPSSVAVPDRPIETWTGFPPMREKYFESRAALRVRVEGLVDRLANSSTR